MGTRGSELGGGGGDRDSDLERFRERLLDQPESPEEVSGQSNDNQLHTGPIKVVVRQDGIGRTGGIVLGIVAGVALGVAVLTCVFFNLQSVAGEREQNRMRGEVARDHDQVVLEIEKVRAAAARDVEAYKSETAMNVARMSDDARLAERESRLLQYYLLELDAKVIKAGIKQPSESIAKKLKKEAKQ